MRKNKEIANELVQSERSKLNYRAKSVAVNSIIFVLIMGSLTTYILSFSTLNWKVGLLNIPILLYMIFYYFFQKSHRNEMLSWVCVFIGIIYLIFIFTIFYVLMLNIISNGNEVSLIRFYPAVLHICIICIMAVCIGPLYINFIINKKSYLKNSKVNMAIIAISSVLGISIGEVLTGNMFLVITSFGIFFIVFILMLSLYYYIFVVRHILARYL